MTHTYTTKTLVALGALLLLGAGALFAEANHTWSKYHWDLSTADTLANPLVLGDNLTTSAWKGSLAIASDDWNQSVIKNTVAPGNTDANCDPTLGQVEVCNGAYGTNGWLGIAQVWAYRGKDGHIAQAIVQLNDSYFNQPAYASAAWRNLVMCQEVGHTFGLGHQDENFYNTNLGTCMDYTNDPDGSIYGQLDNQEPNAHDYAMLEDIYAHLNSTTDGGKGKPDKGSGGGGNGKGKPSDVGAQIDPQDPSSWGRAVKQDALGRNSLYVRDLGNGLEVITHVTWVPEYERDHH